MVSLIVGLGNPGDEYKKNRHNAGFFLLDRFTEQSGVSFSHEVKFTADTCRFQYQGKPLHLIKPQGFMNKSGYSVGAYARYYNIPVEEILVAHDELDLEPGTIRLKKAGGHGGHNGLRDIFAHIPSREFYRLRIGIGHPSDRNQVTQYVLKAASKAQQADINQSIEDGLSQMPEICSGNVQQAMQNLHTA
ncbi:MAG: aminoacyl-tRNA hydrolase [Cycloclasticus sp. symbiont of Poecilosclerida sp. M]|nr:MAG: aminoacyl-tRNA hydrolase [Cycloclasticus sp. symbiont of Poecilosclerida sp. M]